MLCSVVIPLYNKAEFIEAAIESVLKQHYSHFEIIVIDDGSNDDGPARVSAFPDHRIQLVQQTNQGVSCARNKGIELAKGDLVCFLDADDWFLPAYLETMVGMAKTHPEFVFFAAGFRWVSTLDKNASTWDCAEVCQPAAIDNLYRQWLIRGPFFCTNSVAIRRSALIGQQPCFPPGESMGEDQDLWFRLAEQSSLLFCPAQLVAYRIDVSGSLCSTNNVHSLLPLYHRIEARALRRQIPDRFRSSALRLVAHAKVGVARSLLVSGKRFAALGTMLNAWREIGSRRWWVSLLMCMVASPTFFSRWELWRKKQARKAPPFIQHV
jgi:glycosyltransferase involved in cell wall biosynthesis